MAHGVAMRLNINANMAMAITLSKAMTLARTVTRVVAQAATVVRQVTCLTHGQYHPTLIGTSARLHMRHRPAQGHQHRQQNEQVKPEVFHGYKSIRPEIVASESIPFASVRPIRGKSFPRQNLPAIGAAACRFMTHTNPA